MPMGNPWQNSDSRRVNDLVSQEFRVSAADEVRLDGKCKAETR